MLVAVTGASRGFGRLLASAFAVLPVTSMKLVLVSRPGSDLSNTIRDVKMVNPVATCVGVTADLGDGCPATLETSVRCIINACRDPQFPHRVLVHNAGSVGRIGSITGSETPIAELSGSIMLNLTSFVALSEAFLAVHPQSHTTIVNITSLAAVTPFPSLSQYSMWKAAREMYLNCLALEASQDVKVLNYSPGPMATDMTAGFAANPLLDPNLGKQYDDYEQKGTYVDGTASAQFCAALVRSGDFLSGSRCDFKTINDQQRAGTNIWSNKECI